MFFYPIPDRSPIRPYQPELIRRDQGWDIKKDEMKKVNKQCLLDTSPHSKSQGKNLASYSSNQQTLVLKRRFQ